jgi:hypothetical protein
MISWHDLRIWLSGFLGGLAVAAFLAATVMRAYGRARRDEDHAIPKRPVAKADVPDKSKIFRA